MSDHAQTEQPQQQQESSQSPLFKIGDREKMIKGEWPGNGCEYCKVVEDAGGISERIGYINDLQMVPPENETNPEETHVTPRLLEVYFSNLCNLSNLCQLCD